jgi:hypothetical protein
MGGLAARSGDRGATPHEPGRPEGRGAAWLADYDAGSPDVLAA